MADQSRQDNQQPPAPDAVMYFIYDKDGDGATSYEIENGSVATYWYGHEFDAGGKRYFTGFAYDTPEKYNGQQKNAEPDSLATVTLTEATFVMSKPGEKKPWSFVGADRSLVEFGASEKAPELDSSRQPAEFETSEGKLLLAIPAISQTPAENTRTYTLLVFDPARAAGEQGEAWSHLGEVLAGDSGGQFRSREGAAMPDFVTGGGSLTSAAGEQVEIPETYVYDELNNAYLELQ